MDADTLEVLEEPFLVDRRIDRYMAKQSCRNPRSLFLL